MKAAEAVPRVPAEVFSTTAVSACEPRARAGVVNVHVALLTSTVAWPSRVLPSYTLSTSFGPSGAPSRPLSVGWVPSVLVSLEKAPVTEPWVAVVSLTKPMLTSVVGTGATDWTVKSCGALTTRAVLALPAVASSIIATRLWGPSASGVAGVKRQLLPLTVAVPKRVLPSYTTSASPAPRAPPASVPTRTGRVSSVRPLAAIAPWVAPTVSIAPSTSIACSTRLKLAEGVPAVAEIGFSTTAVKLWPPAESVGVVNDQAVPVTLA